jgi:U3 small nucleolar RNA-associated protein 18
MPLLAKSVKRLPMGILEYNRMSDANHEDFSKGELITRFHPKTSLLLVAGLDNKLKLFQVDGVKNHKVNGVAFGDMPIRGKVGPVSGVIRVAAEFTSDGEEIIVTGRRKYYYSYHLGSAKVEKIQYIHGQDEKSLENFVLSPDNKYITVLGKNGNIMMLSRQSKQVKRRENVFF